MDSERNVAVTNITQLSIIKRAPNSSFLSNEFVFKCFEPSSIYTALLRSYHATLRYIHMKFRSLAAATALVVFLSSCGGGSSGNASSSLPTAPTSTPSNGISNVVISSDRDKLAVGASYTLSWTITGEGSCTIAGDVERTVTASGSQDITELVVGERTTTITCGAVSDSVLVVVIPEYISVPDITFGKMLSRLGYTLSSGQMAGADALDVEQLCITSMNGFYGEADEDGRAIFDNPNVPDTGAVCVYTDQGEFISDTAGLEYFLNLRTMRLEHQQFNNIDLNNLTELSFVSLWGNPIYELDLTNTPALTHLGLSETSLTNVDTSNLPELVEAAFQQGDRELPYTTSTGTVVYGFEMLDFSQNGKLERIYIHSNPLSNFGIDSNKSSLQELWANNTPVQSLDLSGFENLRYIILNSSESLTYLNVYGVDNYSVPFRFYCEGCPELEEVIVYDAPAFEAANGANGVYLDDHITFVEGP